jgi:hypothetical protein
MDTPLMLPALKLLRLPLRFKLDLRLSEFFFLRVPLRETEPVVCCSVDDVDALRCRPPGSPPPPSINEEPRWLASKSSLNLPKAWSRCSDCDSGDMSMGLPWAKSATPVSPAP